LLISSGFSVVIAFLDVLGVLFSEFLTLLGVFWADLANSCVLPLEGCCLFDMIYEQIAIEKHLEKNNSG
jgi:hypothetical protein